MSWTVACFCGNVYTAPPARCDVCNRTLSRAVTEGPAAVAPVPDAFLETEDAASHTALSSRTMGPSIRVPSIGFGNDVISDVDAGLGRALSGGAGHVRFLSEWQGTGRAPASLERGRGRLTGRSG